MLVLSGNKPSGILRQYAFPHFRLDEQVLYLIFFYFSECFNWIMHFVKSWQVINCSIL